MSISDKKTQRAVINVCYNLKKSPLETEKTINVTFGENRLNGRGNGCDNNFWSGVKNGGGGGAFVQRIIIADETWLCFHSIIDLPPLRRPASAGRYENTCLLCSSTFRG